MPCLNFMKQFVGRVQSGEKTHSLRAPRKRRWVVGDYLGLYFGQRTKHSRLIGETLVVALQQVELSIDGQEQRFCIRIDDELLAPDEADAFAVRDGFVDAQAMKRHWEKHSDLREGRTWYGDLIHWKFPFEVPNGSN